MSNIKILALGGLMAGLAVLFQLIPVFYSEIFVIFTLLSTLPIYIISRINPKAGIMTFFVAVTLISFFSMHETIFFLFANAPVGLSLGIGYHFTQKKWVVSLVAASILTSTLCIANFIIGIPVFGAKINEPLWVQIGAIFLFSLTYCNVYIYISNKLFNRLLKLINIE